MMLRAVLSSETPDRYDDIIRSNAFNTVKNFKNYFDGNPILLWSHGRDCSVPNLPLGSVKEPDFNGTDMNGKRAFEGTVQFAEHQFAVDVWKLYEAGHLRAFSVGFRPIVVKQDSEDCKGIEFLEVDLLENSAVPIPANPAAMRKAYLDGLVSDDFLEKTFFKMRDEVLVRNSDIFLPLNWKFRDSVNELAILSSEIKAGTFKPYEKVAVPSPKEEKLESYLCDSCGTETTVCMEDFQLKTHSGIEYRDVECLHCQATMSHCIEATELLVLLKF